MPKIKTNKSARKRIVKVTKNKKIMRKKTTAQHLARRKSKRTLQESGEKRRVKKANEKIIELIPYFKKGE